MRIALVGDVDGASFDNLAEAESSSTYKGSGSIDDAASFACK